MENTSNVATPILLTIDMYIEPTRLLEVGSPNAKYNSEGRLRKRYTSVNCSDKGEIAVTMIADDNKDDDDKDS